ncbi:MAG: NAD(P)/FAD-dependent oxidoreductase [Candidatus Rokubacteria bacterium]|nr:NAD(P)/FAD-dependent oxidoreductase [Candidatus Rokubacteria bacterium]
MLVSTVELAWRARRGAELGLTGAAGVGLDWGAIIARKNRIVSSWSEGKDTGLERQGIAVLRGRARFLGPHELEVGARRVTAERVILATGSAPARPPIEGIERALTSDQLLERTTLPGRLVVIGGGMIGMELGFAFGRAGARVTVLQSGPHVLPPVDEELRAALVALAPEAGLDVRTGARVRRIAPDGTVETEIGGRAERFPADAVLAATGRPPNTAGLDLEAAGVAVERGAVKVNGFLQSPTALHVYAAGDVTGAHQHTPAAWYEGALAAENALKGNHRSVDFSVFPTAVFTIPALAQVGLTEAEARRQGFEVAVGRAPFEDSSAAAVRGETEGLVKVVADERTGRVLGVQILGAGAEDLIHVAAVAMRGGLSRRDLAGMHYVFPTLAGSVFDAMWS